MKTFQVSCHLKLVFFSMSIILWAFSANAFLGVKSVLILILKNPVTLQQSGFCECMGNETGSLPAPLPSANKVSCQCSPKSYCYFWQHSSSSIFIFSFSFLVNTKKSKITHSYRLSGVTGCNGSIMKNNILKGQIICVKILTKTVRGANQQKTYHSKVI